MKRMAPRTQNNMGMAESLNYYYATPTTPGPALALRWARCVIDRNRYRCVELDGLGSVAHDDRMAALDERLDPVVRGVNAR